MFWILRAIVLAVIISISAFWLFGSTHIEIDANLVFGLIVVISLSIMLINYLIFKFCMPISYAKYKAWKDKASPSVVSRMVMGPLFFGYLLFFYSFFSYINQYHVNSPIETIAAKINNKTISTGRSDAYYTDIDLFPIGTLRINSKEIFNAVEVGDQVIVKVQSGRLNYFALELKLKKNNFFAKL